MSPSSRNKIRCKKDSFHEECSPAGDHLWKTTVIVKGYDKKGRKQTTDRDHASKNLNCL